MNKILLSKHYKALCCLLGAAALGTMTAAAAAAEEALPAKIVKYDDLDITKPAGAKVLFHRIHAAAVEVCPVPFSSAPKLLAVERACIDHAIDQAVRDVNAPALTELRFASPVRLASK